MKMMLIGAGAVGESILKILKSRDPKKTWFESCMICDINLDRAKKLAELDERYQAEFLDSRNKKNIVKIIKEYGADFVMDASSPFLADIIFDASYEAGVNYGNMGTWSIPKTNPKFGLGIENSYDHIMTKYNFDAHKKWEEKGILATICLGIDPGVVNVFAKYAAQYEFDILREAHVKDGNNLHIPNSDPNQITFGFNVWTVLDEVMNPNVEYNKEKGGFIVEDAFAGEEIFEMGKGIGKNTLVKVEHEEVMTFERYLSKYGLEKATFKISLDDNLITALKVLDQLGLRGIQPVNVNGVSVIPRDVVAAVAPQPLDLGDEMFGSMCVGVHCIGEKDGKHKELFIYNNFDNQKSMKDWGMQAVVAQTGFGASLAIELLAKGIWKATGVHSLENFDPIPYLELMKETGFEYQIEER